MSNTDSHNSANSTTTTTVPNWDVIPCVQYGFPASKGPRRTPKLSTIFEPIPDSATTASPVYLLSRDQYERQQRMETGYEIAGDCLSIAKELQDECEAADQVLYPIHIESDVYHEKGPSELIGWFREFVEDYLEVPFHTCVLYFSGRRSIHVHVPRFVSTEEQRKRLKKRAETFCEGNGAELDCGLYDAKRLFRLPGVAHEKSGLRKVEIEPDWDHTRIVRTANKGTSEIPTSYEAVLRRVFVKDEMRANSGQPYTPNDLFRILDANETVLEFTSNEQDIETPLVEQRHYPESPTEVPRWAQYNGKEFSPYALASGNGRSVAVVKTMGGAFARKEVRNGTTLIPAFFYGARGCAGAEFTKESEYAPLQLSVRDYNKWDYEVGDCVAIVGGQSRNSRIFRVDPWEAVIAGHVLSGKEGSRQTALEFLMNRGYEVGKAGSGENAVASNRDGTPRHSVRVRPVGVARTEAAAFQRQAEQEGIDTLTHKERWRVACRLLLLGWEPAWDWFRRQYGSNFKPDLTREQFQSVVDTFPHEYDHVEAPVGPS